VPTSTGRGRWHKPTVWHILTDRCYIGEARMLRTRHTKDEAGRKVKHWRPEEETLLLPEGTIPPIIDRQTFDRAQERLQRNKAELVRPVETTDALLRAGFISCGSCGRRMTIHRPRPNYLRYVCQQKGECRRHTISAAAIDNAVWSRVETILNEPERLRRILAVPARDLTGEIAAADARIAELKREEAGLFRLAARLEEGDDAAESLLAQLRETVQRRKAVIESRERLESEALDTEARAGRIEATIAAVESVGGATELDYHGKRQALANLSVKVVVYPEWHESNYRWLMWAFERRDDGSWSAWLPGERRAEQLEEVDGDALNRVSAVASPARQVPHRSPRTQTGGRSGSYSSACGAPSARAERPDGGRAWFAPAISQDHAPGALARRKHLTGRRTG
jgi:Recombinase zinc beta ribbon domain/Recombinase